LKEPGNWRRNREWNLVSKADLGREGTRRPEGTGTRILVLSMPAHARSHTQPVPKCQSLQ
jgi:hypothetical protein